jgi:hypothetical protein
MAWLLLKVKAALGSRHLPVVYAANTWRQCAGYDCRVDINVCFSSLVLLVFPTMNYLIRSSYNMTSAMHKIGTPCSPPQISSMNITYYEFALPHDPSPVVFHHQERPTWVSVHGRSLSCESRQCRVKRQRFLEQHQQKRLP